MATKKTTKKSTKKSAAKAPAKINKSVQDMTPRECIQANKLLKMHVTIITVLSIAVCALVVALVLTIKS
jgi:hypothetical protein